MVKCPCIISFVVSDDLMVRLTKAMHAPASTTFRGLGRREAASRARMDGGQAN